MWQLLLLLLLGASQAHGAEEECKAKGFDMLPSNAFHKVPKFGPVPYLLERRSNVDTITMLVKQSVVSGERWETNLTTTAGGKLAVFQYWNFDMILESQDALRNYASGWTNASHLNWDFANCKQTAHYSMLSLHPQHFNKLALMLQLPHNLVYDIAVKLFASCKGVATTLHFDRTDNYFLQLEGTKRFYLFPPEYYNKLYFAPREHPLYRHSLIEPLDLLVQEGFPKFILDDMPEKMVVDLKPGDILFIPRLWAHFVVSVTDTMSLAIRNTNDNGGKEEDNLRKLPLPFESYWSTEEKFAAVRHYLKEVLTEEQCQDLKETWMLAFPSYKSPSPQRRSVQVPNQQRIETAARKLTFTKELFRIEYCEDVVTTMLTAKDCVEFVLNYL